MFCGDCRGVMNALATKIKLTAASRLRNGSTIKPGDYEVESVLLNVVFLVTPRGRRFGILRSEWMTMVEKGVISA